MHPAAHHPAVPSWQRPHGASRKPTAPGATRQPSAHWVPTIAPPTGLPASPLSLCQPASASLIWYQQSHSAQASPSARCPWGYSPAHHPLITQQATVLVASSQPTAHVAACRLITERILARPDHEQAAHFAAPDLTISVGVSQLSPFLMKSGSSVDETVLTALPTRPACIYVSRPALRR